MTCSLSSTKGVCAPILRAYAPIVKGASGYMVLTIVAHRRSRRRRLAVHARGKQRLQGAMRGAAHEVALAHVLRFERLRDRQHRREAAIGLREARNALVEREARDELGD